LPADTRPTKVVLVGHSIGGHAALSAHAFAKSYGLEGELVGVATFAPFWVSALAWGAVLYPGAGITVASAAGLLQFQLDYFYAHGELLDGPGHGLDLIKPEKRELARQMLEHDCLDEFSANLPNLGAAPADYFTQEAIDTLGLCGASGDCAAAEAVSPWPARFRADRPPVDANGPPILMWFGGQDALITPGYARCGYDKLARDVASPGTTQLTMCFDPDAIHSRVPIRDVAWVNDWIAARVGGGPEPTCTPPLPPEQGGAQCTQLPPNDKD
jgi:pimeloyl-ACP methyl ester carboxylesterase